MKILRTVQICLKTFERIWTNYSRKWALQACKYIALFYAGGSAYLTVEVFHRGYTHVSMFWVGGICLVLMGLINEILSWETPLWLQMLIAAVIVTIIEFVAGCIFNLWLGLNVWDYSMERFNVLGQICLRYSVYWYILAAVGIVLDDWLRHWMSGERKPKYIYLWKGVI